MAILHTKNLSRYFTSKGKQIYAVKDINLDVQKGEIFGFLGPNGAGKTTTMRMLTTLLKPSSGEAKIVGHDLISQPEKVRQNIGYISQVGGLELTATGRENLIFQGLLYGMSKADAQTRSNYLIKELKLETFADRLARTYSGGQKRIIDLALGMIHKPAVLFMDEPTLGLDPAIRIDLWNQIRLLKSEGTTIFITTHYLDEADAICDRLAIIDRGSIIAQGTSNELKSYLAGDAITLGLLTEDKQKGFDLLREQPFVKEINLIENGLKLYVDSGEKQLATILRTLDNSNIHINTISLNHPSLDDVFLHFTGKSLQENREK